MEMKTYLKARYHALKSENRCVQCGAQDERTLGGKICCERCAQYHAIMQINYMMKRRQEYEKS